MKNIILTAIISFVSSSFVLANSSNMQFPQTGYYEGLDPHEYAVSVIITRTDSNSISLFIDPWDVRKSARNRRAWNLVECLKSYNVKLKCNSNGTECYGKTQGRQKRKVTAIFSEDGMTFDGIPTFYSCTGGGFESAFLYFEK